MESERTFLLLERQVRALERIADLIQLLTRLEQPEPPADPESYALAIRRLLEDGVSSNR